MKRLLIVGDADSIFFVKYVEALKASMDIHVTVYSPFPKKGWYSEYPYDDVYFDDYIKSKIGRIRPLWPFVFRYKFHKFLKSRGVKYDILHFHWLLESWTFYTSEYHKYAAKVGVSFWGGELESLRILFSNKIYLYKLKDLLDIADFGIGSTAKTNSVVSLRYPSFIEKCSFGVYGSSIVDEMITMTETRVDACKYYSIPEDKIVIMLGYSGKKIHRHCDLLQFIQNNHEFQTIKDRIHFVVNMTRGSWPQYSDQVYEALTKTGCSFTYINNRFLSDKEVALLRKTISIIFQVTDFDEISASIVESLSAGSLMIAGDWFPNYAILRKYGFEWLEVDSIESAVNVFYEIIARLDSFEKMTESNKKIGIKYFSWHKCIIPWKEIYEKQLLSCNRG